MKKLLLALTLLPSLALAQSVMIGPATSTIGDCPKFADTVGKTFTDGACGGGGGGVSQIVAGTNVSISPSGGTGTVTINSGNTSNLPATQLQTANAHGSGTVTITFGSTPTPGNIILFFISGYTNSSTNYFTPPAGVSYLNQQSTNNEGVALLLRAVQAGDGTSWAFTSPANDFTVTGIEISGATEVASSTVNFGNNPSSSTTNIAPLTSIVQSGHLIYGLFNVENATSATGATGWSTITLLGTSGTQHTSFVTSRAFNGVPPQVTWTNGSTSQAAMGLTVSISGNPGSSAVSNTPLTFSGSTINVQGNATLPCYSSQALTLTSGTRYRFTATFLRASGRSGGLGIMNSSGQGVLIFLNGSSVNTSVLLSRENTGSATNYQTSGSNNPAPGWITFQLVLTPDSTNGATVWGAQEGGVYTALFQDSTYNFASGTWYACMYDLAGYTSSSLNAAFVTGPTP